MDAESRSGQIRLADPLFAFRSPALPLSIRATQRGDQVRLTISVAPSNDPDAPRSIQTSQHGSLSEAGTAAFAAIDQRFRLALEPLDEHLTATGRDYHRGRPGLPAKSAKAKRLVEQAGTAVLQLAFRYAGAWVGLRETVPIGAVVPAAHEYLTAAIEDLDGGGKEEQVRVSR